MTRDASDPLGGTPPWTGRLQTHFTIVVFGLVVLAMVMFWVWVSGVALATFNQMPGPLAQFAKDAAWGLVAALGLCCLLVPGFVLCVRPALFALIVPRSGLSRWSGVRRWPRLSGFTLVWAGVWMIGLALAILAQALRAPRQFLPPFDNTALVVIFAVAFVPNCTLMLAALLVRLARR